jgi:3-methyladenine DNA glycosylase AlkD
VPGDLAPETLAAESRARLAAAADPKVAARALSYFKAGERVECYGLAAPALRQMERELWRRVARRWTLRDAVAYCEAMLAAPQLEAKGLGLMVLARFERAFTPGLLKTAKSWLTRGRCANWATTDTLSLLVIAPIVRDSPAQAATIAVWTRSRSLWVRRAAAVSLVPLARRGQALPIVYGVAVALRGDESDLVHKATGWLLREAGKTDPLRLERFLLARGKLLPRTALRYAIERFAAAQRQRLLVRTSSRS